jgi:hypothetical protein
MSSRGGRRRNAPPKRHVRPPRPHPAELDPTRPHAPLPSGTVMVVCGETGDVLGDVLERDEGWHPDGRCYDIGLIDAACTAEVPHLHVHPSQDEIAASVAEAKEYRTVIQHRVKVRR